MREQFRRFIFQWREERKQLATRYRQPRRINWVSALLWMVAIAIGYALFQFGPVFYRKWQVHEVLGDAARRAGRYGHVHDLDVVDEVRNRALRRIRGEGVSDPELTVEFVVSDDGRQLAVSAHYTEIVVHPFVLERTRIPMNPSFIVEVGLTQTQGDFDR